MHFLMKSKRRLNSAFIGLSLAYLRMFFLLLLFEWRGLEGKIAKDISSTSPIPFHYVGIVIRIRLLLRERRRLEGLVFHFEPINNQQCNRDEL